MNKILLVSVGNVQQYISNAEKPADLYAGSLLVGKAIEDIIKLVSNNKLIKIIDFIIPQQNKMKSNSLPNYFMAVIDSKINDDDLEEAIRDSIKLTCNIPKLLSVYVVVEDSNGDYRTSYDRLYKKLDSRKCNRLNEYDSIIANNNEAAKIGRCYICGINPVSVDESKKALCVECQLKRKEGKSYPSTVNLACAEWCAVIENKKEDRQEIVEYKNYLKQNFECIDNCIANGFYIDRIKTILEDQKVNTESNLYKCLMEKIEGIYTQYGIVPSTYYALVRADIDDMGKIMSGTYCQGDLLNFQKNLSLSMSKFTESIREELRALIDDDLNLTDIDKEFSSIIYSGGDDILFFCPLYKLMDAVNMIDNCLLASFDNMKLTVSKSVVIANINTPIKYVVKTSVERLNYIKKLYEERGKNGIDLTLINRSNGVRSVYFKNNELMPYINKILQCFQKNMISRSALFSLEKDLSVLGSDIESRREHRLFICEIDRIMQRCINSYDDELKDCIHIIFENFGYKADSSAEKGLNHFFDLVHILDKMSNEIIGGEL